MEWLDTFLEFVGSTPAGQLLFSLVTGVAGSGLYTWLTQPRPLSANGGTQLARVWVTGLLKLGVRLGIALFLLLLGLSAVRSPHPTQSTSADAKLIMPPVDPVKRSVEVPTKAQSTARPRALTKPDHAGVPNNAMTVHVSGDIGTSLQQSIRSSLESRLRADGIAVRAHKGSHATHSIEVTLSRDLMNNADAYGSSLYSAGCSGAVHVFDATRGGLIAVQNFQPTKRAVGFNPDEAVATCIESIKPDIEHFVDANVARISK